MSSDLKSSMRSSISGGGGILYQECPILCGFDNIFVPLDLTPAAYIVSYTLCVETKISRSELISHAGSYAVDLHWLSA